MNYLKQKKKEPSHSMGSSSATPEPLKSSSACKLKAIISLSSELYAGIPLYSASNQPACLLIRNRSWWYASIRCKSVPPTVRTSLLIDCSRRCSIARAQGGIESSPWGCEDEPT